MRLVSDDVFRSGGPVKSLPKRLNIVDNVY